MGSYPKLFLRIKASIWDSTILGLFFILIVLISSLIEFSSEIFQSAFILLPTLSLEPLLVYFTGSSIGHRIAGIKIIHSKDNQKLSLLQCYSRFMIKALLGLLSLLMFVFTKRYQAIHDYLSKSIVVFIDEAKSSTNHKVFGQHNVYISFKPLWTRRFTS